MNTTNGETETCAAECKHLHTHEETVTRRVARWVPSWDEDYNENDPQRTEYVTDGKLICDDCGEILDVSIGD